MSLLECHWIAEDMCVSGAGLGPITNGPSTLAFEKKNHLFFFF